MAKLFPKLDDMSCAASLADSDTSSGGLSSYESRRRPLETGFDCEFVEKPRELQPDCPICLHILREPHQTTCCGNSFCKTCIKRIEEDGKPCPTCNEVTFNSFHDKRLQHTLYDFQVVCSNSQMGCEWKGELRELEKHLNANPTPEKQLDGCQYEMVACVFCHAEYMRKDIQLHQGSKCGKRPYSCEYCGNYQSTCDDVTDNHWPVCPCRPIQCPNDCGVYPERRNLAIHLEKECKNQIKMCKFKYAGCHATLHPEDVQSHMEENVSHHLSLLAEFSQKWMLKAFNLEEKVKGLEKQIEERVQPTTVTNYGLPAETNFYSERGLTESSQTNTEVQILRRDLRALRLQYENRDHRIEHLERQNQRLQSQIADLVNIGSNQELRSHMCLVPVVYTLSDFSIRSSHPNMPFKPHPFYTFPQGYKMQLSVNMYGDGDGRGTHISVFLCLMKGEFDDQLKWPFRGSVTIQLLNQEAGSEQHFSDRITYRDSTSDQMAGRVMDERRTAKPWGKVKFFPKSDIPPNFVKDDCVKFRISQVDM